MFQFFEVLTEDRSSVIDAGDFGKEMNDVPAAVETVIESLRETWRDSVAGSKVQINFKNDDGDIVASTGLIEV